jgi:hypothetical protein
MEKIIKIALVVVGLIHLLPLIGVLGSQKLASLYGLSFDDPNLAILMRHRAILFGLLGSFLVYGAFTPALQVLALIAGYISIVSFLVLAWSVGQYNSEIGRIVIMDVVALLCLIAASAAYLWSSRNI